ncbi:MAG: signal peptidase II [Candidatus Izemoplasmatales bacterium]
MILLIGLILADQASKFWVVHFFAEEGDTLPIIEGFFHFTYVRNPGAVFGLGGNVGFALYFFIGVALIATGVFGYLFFKNDFRDRRRIVYSVGLTLLIAGTFGNAIDRMVQFDHKVVDFIDFRGIWIYVFNVADMCLTIGIILFLIDQLILEPKRSKAHEE